MLISGVPIDIKHLHRILADIFLRKIGFRRGRCNNKIHYVYFSCSRDIDIIKLSISSLINTCNRHLSGITVVVDTKNPFSSDEMEQIAQIYKPIEFLHLGPIDWASTRTLLTELNTFKQISNKLDPNNLIAKVDSDVLFFSEHKIIEIAASKYDFIGDGHFSSYKYAQGGLYFIRASLAKKICEDLDTDKLEEISKIVGTPAEDQVISWIIRQLTKRIWLTRIMLFPREYNRTNLLNNFVKMEFSAIHFIKQKSDMPIFYENIFRSKN